MNTDADSRYFSEDRLYFPYAANLFQDEKKLPPHFTAGAASPGIRSITEIR
jgi:hypothetical protein